MGQDNFTLTFQNVSIKKIYDSCDNYEELELSSSSDRCAVFFSSNGLYFPNTEECFTKAIIQGNRYEWKNLCIANEKIKKYFGKIIFVRDVFKAWYVAGINSKVDSIDSLCALISELTKGYKLITVGSSAGGYIATIVGIRLNALRIYNFSGQWFLKDVCKSPLLSYFANDVKHSQFYDMEWVDFESMSILPPIVYFFPKGNADDIEQEKYMRSKKCDNIIYFPIRSKEHGIAVYRENLPYLMKGLIPQLCWGE